MFHHLRYIYHWIFKFPSFFSLLPHNWPHFCIRSEILVAFNPFSMASLLQHHLHFQSSNMKLTAKESVCRKRCGRLDLSFLPYSSFCSRRGCSEPVGCSHVSSMGHECSIQGAWSRLQQNPAAAAASLGGLFHWFKAAMSPGAEIRAFWTWHASHRKTSYL